MNACAFAQSPKSSPRDDSIERFRPSFDGVVPWRCSDADAKSSAAKTDEAGRSDAK